MMDRRAFFASVFGLFAAPLTAEAQQAMTRIGISAPDRPVRQSA
jgi:hypothetical protein